MCVYGMGAGGQGCLKTSLHVCVYIYIYTHTYVHTHFPGDSVVKNPPAMQELQETWVRSLGGEDPLEQGLAAHSSVLAWRVPWTEEPGGSQSTGLQRIRHN